MKSPEGGDTVRKHRRMVDQSGDVSKGVFRLRVERKVVDHVLVVFSQLLAGPLSVRIDYLTMIYIVP